MTLPSARKRVGTRRLGFVTDASLVTVTVAAATLLLASLPAQAAPAPLVTDVQAPASAPASAPAQPTGPASCGAIPIPDSIDGTQPGDLIGYESVPTTNQKGTVDLLPDGRAWRILYTSSGIDETSPELVCGLVVAPATWTPGDRGQMIAWAHGTTGLRQDCQPSAKPWGLFGATPGGIGALSWGALTNGATTGLPEDGMLATLIAEGYVVAATDYFSGIMPTSAQNGTPPLQHYVAGVPSGENVLDSVRAAISVMAAEFDPSAQTLPWDLLTWGHSQGGGAALWAGQLAQDYLAQTQPSVAVGPIRLVGVAAEAPATSFAAPSTDLAQLPGSHLGDMAMHQSVPIGAFAVQIGPALFSYVLPNWAELSEQTPSAGALFPATPSQPGDDELDLSALLAGQDASPAGAATWGLQTASTVATECVNNQIDVAAIWAATKPYRKPASNYYFVPEIWGNAPNYTTGQLDQTCATTDDDGILAWCRWLRFNNPGPTGQNPFDKVPRNDQGIVPMYVMQGEGDNIIDCDATAKNADGSTRDQDNPLPTWCLSQQFASSLVPYYCPTDGAARGSLQVGFWPVESSAPAYHPATHMSLPGQVGSDASVNGGVTPNPNLIFANSALYDFMNQAFTLPGALPQGCSQQVMWDASR